MCNGGPPLGVKPFCSKTVSAPSVSLEDTFKSRTFNVTPFIFKCLPNLASPALTLQPLYIFVTILLLKFVKNVNEANEKVVSTNFFRFMVLSEIFLQLNLNAV